MSALALAAALSGCASWAPDRSLSYEQDDLARFAYDLGSTHAGLAQCSEIRDIDLDAHLESARIALQGQAGARFTEVSPVFEQGLREPAKSGHRLHIDCSCATDLVKESLHHNQRLYREVTLPKATKQARNS